MSRYARRKDANQNEIVRALHQAMISTFDLSRVGGGLTDILAGALMPCPQCGFRFRQNKLIEIKNAETRGKLNRKQVDFFEAWRGQRVQVYTPEEALRECGVRI